MDKWLRQDPAFVDYVSIKHRHKELERLDERICALRKAREILEKSPIARIPKKRYKSAQYWCKYNDWSSEDAVLFVQEYATQRKTSKSSSNVSSVVSGLSRVTQAVVA